MTEPRNCIVCSHTHHGDRECDEMVGYDHLNGDHECGCAGEVDLLLIEEPKDGPGFPAHDIVVMKVAYDEPAGSFGISPTELEFGIDHGRCQYRGDECIVESTVNDLGLHQALFGVWSKGENGERLEERAYRVRGWASKSPATPNGPEEYDAGIEETDEALWPDGTEIPFRSDGSMGLPVEGTFVIRNMPKDEEATDGDT